MGAAFWGCLGGRPTAAPLRARRTARADNPGTALTFVLPEERDRLAQIEDRLAGGRGGALSPWGGGHRVPRDIVGVPPRAPGARECPQGTSPCVSPENGGSMLQPYKFCMEEIEGLRYRCRVSTGGDGDGNGGVAAVPPPWL